MSLSPDVLARGTPTRLVGRAGRWMLELTRLGKLRLRQTEAFTDILIEAVIADAPDVSAPTVVTVEDEPPEPTTAPVEMTATPTAEISLETCAPPNTVVE